MGEWTGYNANNDMDKRTTFAFDRLSKEDKKYIEDAWHAAKKKGSPLTNAELKSAVKIRASKSLIKDRKAEWEKGNFPNQKTDPERAKDYLDQIIGIHQNIIKENKAAHKDSEFIQEANLLDKGIGTLKDVGENVGGGILKIARALDPFGSAHAATNQKKDDFTFKLEQDDSFVNWLSKQHLAMEQEQMEGSNKGSVLDKDLEPFDRQFSDTVYEDIGEHANRKIPGLNVQHPQDYDKANFFGIDSEAQDIANREFAADPTFQTSEEEEEYNEYLRSIEQMPTIKDPNIFQRFRNNFYKPAAGAVNYGGETYSPAQLNQMNALGGYYSEPARAQRRWEKRQTNVLNRAAAGKPVGNVDLLLGEQGYTSDGDGGISFTGTPQGDPTAGADYSRTEDKDSWSYSPFKQGGRVRYAEGGIVNLLPKGAW